MTKIAKAENKKAEYSGEIPNTPLRFLWYVSLQHKLWMATAIFAAGFAALLSQGSNIFFKWIVEAVESGNTETAMMYALSYPVVLFMIQTTYRLSGWCGMHWVILVQKTVSDMLFGYVTSHSHSYFINRFAGSLLNKMGNTVGAMESFITSFLWSHLNAFLSMLVTLFFISTVDMFSAGLFLALVVLLVYLNYRWMPKKRLLSKITAEAGTKLRGQIVDVYGNIAATRQYVRVHSEVESQNQLTSEWIGKRKRNWLYTEKTLFFNGLLLAIFGLGIFYSVIQRWETGLIGTGDVIFVLALISQLSGTLIFIGRAMTDTARSYGEAEEGLSELLLVHDIKDTQGAKTLKVKSGKIVWENVNFTYGNNSVFKDFDLTIEPGQRVGLVGPSGSGKTTFVSLLLRQHDIDSGTIMIDGQDISAVTQDSLREAIAVVPQEPMLFHRSIRENIAYGKPDASEEEIEAVAKKAQAHDFISSLEEGYDTLVGERGVKLSGGQKQRIAIARAMLKDAPILVLDEATSALDSESEVAIQQALEVLMEGKTVIAVAHRLSTLREMDRILVLEAGKVMEDGNHTQLSKSGGTYQRLWEHQAGGFVGE